MPVLQMRESNPALFEESIARRGQHMLWYSANACFCTSDAGRVDPNCPTCFGKGFTYRPVTSTRQITWGVSEGRKTIDISSKGIVLKSINRLVKGRATITDIPLESFNSTSFTTVTALSKGERYILDFVNDFERSYSGSCSYLGRNIVAVPIRTITTQGLFPGMLTEVTSLRNETKETDIEVVNFWSNKILVNSVIDTNDVLSVVCKYCLSFVLLIVGIDPKMKIQTNIPYQDADAMLAFPGTYHIGRGDVVVLLMGESKESIVGSSNNTNYYKFPHFKIARILRLEDKIGEITDYTIVRDNEIMWGARKPQRFSVSYTYHPAFSVMDTLPNLRYSEDKIFPRRVTLKKFSYFDLDAKTLTQPSTQPTGIIDDPRKHLEQGGIF